MRSAPRAARGSIRRRLLGSLIGIVLVTWILTGVISYFDARRELGNLLDAHLAHTASMLMALRSDDLIKLESVPQLHRYSHDISFQIWENGVALQEHWPPAPATGRPPPVADGFSDMTVDGVSWRVFTLRTPQTQRLVQTAERHDARNRMAGAIAMDITLPIAVALPIVGALLWIGIVRGLRPLRAVSAELAMRKPETLTPLEIDAMPDEIRPLVDNLNRLFARVDTLLERERRFTADAAHELRTPLAAIRAQAQVARSAAVDEQRTHALNGVITGSDRASRLVDQLLTLARVDQEVAITQTAALDAVLAATVADIAPVARSKNVAIVLADTGPVPVHGDSALLRILFRNLLENAVRYSPPDTVVHIDAVRGSARADVVITDEGPGVGAEALPQLGRRFYRAGATEPGSGLGLSIAIRIAQLHGGTIRFATPPAAPGLQVTTSFPVEGSVAELFAPS